MSSPAIGLPYDYSKLTDYSGKKEKSITVYCWSRTEEGTPLWNEAEKMGRLAAENGYSVITGGYSGSMEAVSKGARQVVDQMTAANGPEGSPQVVGILVPGQFPDRDLVGNKYLTQSEDAVNFPRRVETLVSKSRYYVVLPGTLGTLQEFSTIWVLSLIHPAGLPKPIIFAYRDPWEKVVRSVAEHLKLPGNNSELITFVDSAEDVMRLVKEDEARLASPQ